MRSQKNIIGPFKKLTIVIDSSIMRSFKYLKSIFKLKPMYYFINLSSLWEFEWYASQLRKIADIEYCDIHTYPQNTPHYSTPIQIYDEIPYSFMNVNVPIIYFVNILGNENVVNSILHRSIQIKLICRSYRSIGWCF